MERNRQKWSPEEDQKMWELYKRDISLKAIATILGRSCDSVGGRLRKVRKRKRG